MTYKLTDYGAIIRLADRAYIPPVMGNGDYRDYVQWLEEGNIPEPADPKPPIITLIVTMRQARLALMNAGLLDQVDAAIEALPSPQKEYARIEWEYSQEVHRQKPFVQQLGAALGLSPEQIAALFEEAVKL
jgi:hypothetical protein